MLKQLTEFLREGRQKKKHYHHRGDLEFAVYIYIYIYIHIHIVPNVLGHPLLIKGLTTLVISMSTNLNV